MTIYKQYDSRWSRKNYNGSSSIGTAACGPFSVANVIVEHKSINPMDVVKFMQKNGYAIRKKGTAWDGIPAAMKHFGMKDVKAVNVSKSMSKVWEYMKKGYDAEFLFSDGSRGGVCWTTQGHYVAMVGYKVKNGKHYLKAKDSGGKNHDGWYCYETQMKGLIPKVWVGKMDGSAPKPAPKKKPTKKYSGTIPTPTLKKGSKGVQVKYLQMFLNWYFKQIGKNIVLAVDSVFGSATQSALKAFQSNESITADAIYGKSSQAKAKAYKKADPKPAKTVQDKMCDWAKKIADGGQYKYKRWDSKDEKTKQCPICHNLTGKYKGWNCIGFAFACWKHGGGLKTNCNCGVINNSQWEDLLKAKTDADATKIAQKCIGIKDVKVIRNGGKAISTSNLKKGDIIGLYDGKTIRHIVLYIGNEKIAESTSSKTPNIGYGRKLAKTWAKVAIRYTK